MAKYENDLDESILAVKAVDLSHQEARARKAPLYYVENGFLIEEHNKKKTKIAPMKRNQLYGR